MSQVPPTFPPRTGAAPPTVPGPPVAPAGNDTAGRTCVVCAYSLHGLAPDGLCPECGTPVAHSIRGNLLKYASPEYLKRLHRGVILIQTGIILGVPVAVASALAVPGAGAESVAALAGVAVSAVSACGWWLFTELDPGHAATDSGATPRTMIRASVLASIPMAVVSTVADALKPAGSAASASDPLTILSAIANLGLLVALTTRYFAAMLYLRWLAGRIPDEKVRTRAKDLMWPGPLVLLLFVIGLVVVLVLYWRMLTWVRKDLKRIRAENEAARLASS